MKKDKAIDEELTDKRDYNDLPIGTPEEDLFGYKDFAKNVANRILEIEKPKGTVIGLQGEWGSGKTSILNMIEHYLKIQNTQNARWINIFCIEKMIYSKENIKTIIIKIDPWWFSESEHLTERFLIEVAKGLGSKHYKEIKKCIAILCDSLSVAFKNVPLAEGGFKGFSHALEYTKPLYDQKLVLENKLSKLKAKIIIFIDDIDRLETKELKALLKAVKALGNLPNIIYLLAYDPEVVYQILSQNKEYGCDGRSYLEKIVQVTFDIPTPDAFGFVNYSYKMCTRLFGSELSTNYTEANFGELYFRWIKILITSPRKLIRYFNEVSLVYTSIKDDVNFIDLLGIILLKTLNYKWYTTIKENPKYFLDDFEVTIDMKGNKDTDSFAKENNIIKDSYTNEEKLTLWLLFALFPKFKDRLSYDLIEKIKPWFSIAKTDPLKKGRHINAKDFFPTYFRMSLLSESVSMKMVNQIIFSTDQEEVIYFFSSLFALNEENFEKLYMLIDLLYTNRDNINSYVGEHIIRCLFKLKEETFNFKKHSTISTYYLEDICNYLISHILENVLVNEEEKLLLLSDIFINGTSMNLKIKLCFELFKYNGIYKDVTEKREVYLVSNKTLENLKMFILASIKSYLNDINNLGKLNNVFRIFYLYESLDAQDYTAWLKTFDEDEILLKLINLYFSRIPVENDKLNRFYLDDYAIAFNNRINIFDNLCRLEKIRDDKDILLEKKYISILIDYIKSIQETPTPPPSPTTSHESHLES